MNKRIDQVLSLLSPHICKGCGRIGETLCERCIINTLNSNYPICLSCRRVCKNHNLCLACINKLPFDDLIAIGPRRGTLMRLVGDFKYNSELASSDAIASLLSRKIDGMYKDFTIVPIPTIDKHIRQRGFDHMLAVTRAWSRLDNCPMNNKLLFRSNNVSQHTLTSSERCKAASESILIHDRLPCPDNVIILDDIWTTGATMMTVAKKLKQAGAHHVVGVVVAVQPR